MKPLIVREAFHDTENDAVDLHTVRYKAAFEAYQHLVARNTNLYLSGGKISDTARQDEERALDALDCARHRLLDAAAHAYPTLH
jgi:hypothetical protein